MWLIEDINIYIPDFSTYRVMIRQKASSHLAFKCGKMPHLTESLEAYTKPCFFLHSFSFSDLKELACQTYFVFGTLQSFYTATRPAEDTARTYCGRFIEPDTD